MFLCTKPIILGDKQYQIGDAIGEEAILPSRVLALKSQGYIAESGSGLNAEKDDFTTKEGVNINLNDGNLHFLERADIQIVIDVLLAGAEDGAKTLEEFMENGGNPAVALVISKADKRKTITAVAEKLLDGAKETAANADES